MKLAWRILLGVFGSIAILAIGSYTFGGSDKEDNFDETAVQPLMAPMTEKIQFDPLDTPMLRRFFQKYNSSVMLDPQPVVHSESQPYYYDVISPVREEFTTARFPIQDEVLNKVLEIQVHPAAEQIQPAQRREHVISWQEFMDEVPDLRFPTTKSSSQSVVHPVNEFVFIPPHELTSRKSPISFSNNIEIKGTTKGEIRRDILSVTATNPPRSCRLEGVVTVQDGGRLGNKLWEYASVWAFGRTLNMRPLVPAKLSNYLKRFFQDLSVGNLEDALPEGCPTEPEAFGEPMKRWKLFPLETLKKRLNHSAGGNLVLHRWIIVPEPVLALRGEPLKKEFRFHQRFLEEADRTLQSIADEVLKESRNSTRSNITYVGVHVRRTDFAQWLPRVYNKSLATATYFRQAMDYYRKEIDGLKVFVVISDDPAWVKTNLGARSLNTFSFQHINKNDVYLGTKEEDDSFKGIGHDFALLSLCNHSIIDYGTFGAWGALLAGGNTISLESDQHLDNQFQNIIPGWRVWSDPGVTFNHKKIM